ncbi:uncharacterized protein AB675_4563 [Cyphellophora attinorum]|uniref:VOC domain-containing protein n=1 Tax=Cyphellophora attinorum TaxID=1664694 RepID=A0A0N1NZL1_9EURO|nr:uncharacterized protein AB675_4563 [Phialophora attinorum]KPI38936.1 hypothetical protein AB675_4563 [Phialophora attinorum]
MSEHARALLDTAWGVIPHFHARSIPTSITYYTSVLHFNLGSTDISFKYDPASEPEPNMCSIYLGPGIRGANIYIFKRPVEEVLHPSTIMIALGTEAVDAYYELLVREGKAEIIKEIEDKRWGYRQFAVQDPDGNRIQFFRFLDGGNPGVEVAGMTDADTTESA